MKRGTLIGLAGPAGVGKTFVANQFDWDHNFARVSFGEPLKRMSESLLRYAGVNAPRNFTRGDYKETPLDQLGGVSTRKVMQTLGTEWGRDQIDPDFWVMLGIRRAEALLDEGVSVVIDDVRFDNEAAAIRKAGGMIFGVRGESTREVSGDHISERGVAVDDDLFNYRGDDVRTRSEVQRAILLASTGGAS